MQDTVPKLGLGTAQFGGDYGIASDGGEVSDDTIAEMLSMAREAGITTLDTAIAYKKVEERLGQHDLEGFNIVTKFSVPTDDWTRFRPERLLEQSLKSLSVDRVDAVLIHNAEALSTVTLSKALELMAPLLKHGRCRRIGVSLYDPGRLADIAKKFPIKIAQLPFNAFDQRLIKGDTLDMCLEYGIEIHARSLFLQGLLIMDEGRIPPYFQKWGGNLKAWRQWNRKQGFQSLQGAISLASGHRGIGRLIVGADNPEQLSAILETAADPKPISAPELSCDDLDLITPSLWKEL